MSKRRELLNFIWDITGCGPCRLPQHESEREITT